ncbi:cyanocobalamin reductase / alkylcobalamin dealkylase isoform X2 [Lithobates pipiens]
MEEEHVEIRERLQGALRPYGFHIYPFQVGWYNAVLDPVFHLSYPGDTLAFVVISAPSMFTNSFRPFLKEKKLQSLQDPIDQCVAHHMTLAKEHFPSHQVDIIYDYELHPNRRPKVLMQTAAHVSGAAYYYQRKDVPEDPWEKRVRSPGGGEESRGEEEDVRRLHSPDLWRLVRHPRCAGVYRSPGPWLGEAGPYRLRPEPGGPHPPAGELQL